MEDCFFGLIEGYLVCAGIVSDSDTLLVVAAFAGECCVSGFAVVAFDLVVACFAVFCLMPFRTDATIVWTWRSAMGCLMAKLQAFIALHGWGVIW